MIHTVGFHKIRCSGPADLTQAQMLIAQGVLCPLDIVAVIGKTEGNGCVNDLRANSPRKPGARCWHRSSAVHPTRCIGASRS